MSRGFPKRAAQAAIGEPEVVKASEAAPPSSPSTPPDPKAYLGREDDPKSIVSFEKKYVAARFEHGAAFTPDGKPLKLKLNGSNEIGGYDEKSIGLSVEVSERFMNNPGSIFVHNHPSSRSFSGADVVTMFGLGISEMRVMSRFYTYSLKDPNGVLAKYREGKRIMLGKEVGWRGNGIFANPSTFQGYFERKGREIDQEALMREMTEKLGKFPSDDDFGREVSHRRMEAIAKELGLVYERTPNKTA